MISPFFMGICEPDQKTYFRNTNNLLPLQLQKRLRSSAV